jgi:arsenate reductase (thioredoxin)
MEEHIKAQSAGETDLPAIIQLLRDNNLPVADIGNSSIQFIQVKNGEQTAGVIGLETFENNGLLRSMATDSASRNRGIASVLVNELMQRARQQGLKTIYLLTETAENFFAKKGFIKITRDEVPDTLKASAEFSHLCPSSASVMKMEIKPQKKILFVCVENSNRSQMSQAFAKLSGGENVDAYSAGSKPSGIINPKAIAAMKELGYDLSTHDSKSLQAVEQYAPFDAVVTMGCGDACPWMPAKKFIDWQIPDPRNMDEAEFRQVRDLIKEKVAELLVQL